MKTFQPMVVARILASALFAAGSVSSPLTVQGQTTFRVLYPFTGSPDGGNPYAGLTLDAAGNLYGTTYVGGPPGCFADVGCGTAFQLTPDSGNWSESVLYSFTGGSDGGNPLDSLAIDSAGNLYGTAEFGGISCGEMFGCGVAFELSAGSGSWTETVLYDFQGGTDGYYPVAALAFDKQGRLYSTLANGGTYGSGSVYKLSRTGGWKKEILHSFNGWEPVATVTLDAAGNVYGTAPLGGVWELLHGSWKEKTLYGDAGRPEAGLVFDRVGNLYGQTESGGNYNKGSVFKLAPEAKRKWKETVLYSFKGGRDGEYPYGTAIFDKAGNLYGVTYIGGDPSCNPPSGCGTVFKLTPGKRGHWKETVLHRFTGGADGSGPYSENLVFDAAGNLYGTATYGGNSGCLDNFGCGVVFEITP